MVGKGIGGRERCRGSLMTNGRGKEGGGDVETMVETEEEAGLQWFGDGDRWGGERAMERMGR